MTSAVALTEHVLARIQPQPLAVGVSVSDIATSLRHNRVKARKSASYIALSSQYEEL